MPVGLEALEHLDDVMAARRDHCVFTSLRQILSWRQLSELTNAVLSSLRQEPSGLVPCPWTRTDLPIH
jgi:hypothetical protein